MSCSGQGLTTSPSCAILNYYLQNTSKIPSSCSATVNGQSTTASIQVQSASTGTCKIQVTIATGVVNLSTATSSLSVTASCGGTTLASFTVTTSTSVSGSITVMATFVY